MINQYSLNNHYSYQQKIINENFVSEIFNIISLGYKILCLKLF
jgi:hypothetical protein